MTEEDPIARDAAQVLREARRRRQVRLLDERGVRGGDVLQASAFFDRDLLTHVGGERGGLDEDEEHERQADARS